MRCEWCHRTFASQKAVNAHVSKAHKERGGYPEYWLRFLAPACGYCSAKIPYRADHQHGKRQYCSMSCAQYGTAHRGADNSNWKGGAWSTPDGYVMRQLRSLSEAERSIVEPMFRTKGGRYRPVGEHRVVAALMIGRPLSSDEHVHHVNGLREDNRPENLELVIAGHGAGFSSNVSMSCPCCGHKNIARAFL